jgi:HAD superfamily hydrolase (TIGR01549 family)
VIKKYGAVLFDLDGTLLDFEAFEANALGKAFRRVGVTVEWITFWGLTSLQVHDTGVPRRTTQEKGHEAIMRAVLDALGLEDDPTPALTKTYWGIFSKETFLEQCALQTIHTFN